MKHLRIAFGLILGLLVAAPPLLAQIPGGEEAAAFLEEHARSLGLSPADIADLEVTDRYVSSHNGVTHLYLRQRVDGIPVHNAIMTMVLLPDGRVLSTGNRFVAGVHEAITGSERSLGPLEAARVASDHLGITPQIAFHTVEELNDEHVLLSDAGIAQEPIPARLVYLPLEGGAVRLAWMIGIYTRGSEHYWNVAVDAATGEVLQKVDLVVHDGWGEVARRSMLEVPRSTFKMPVLLPRRVSHVASAPGATVGQYRVYQFPLESPSHAGSAHDDLRTVAQNPADVTASPFGWHSTGIQSYTITRGNNVHAYTDVTATDFPDPGSEPDGGSGLVFDFPLDFSHHPSTYRAAAVTNLFYWNNITHDIAYRYGFDEPAGNFQINNFGRGGLGGDPVRAEAQDGGGMNNATFFTPPDGSPPRMQMFIWASPPSLQVHEPASIAGVYAARPATFGPQLGETGITGHVTPAIDGTGATTACNPIANDVAGRIAMIDRGECLFVTKVANAQQAGATAVIMVNNVGGEPITMGGEGPEITIPSIMISQSDGSVVKGQLSAGVRVTMSKDGADLDSDFDAGIIVHEYAHGISNRLTGGPSAATCLTNAQQAGEGWSDWYGLMLTGGDQDHRGIGTYSLSQPTSGQGLRPARYSTSMATNPYTYRDIGSLSVPHGVGFVFASMLWDMTQLLIQDHGYDPDLYNGSGGNNLALQLVTDGLKLQPCNPGFVDSRDAILTADGILTGGTNQCRMWQAFARRGLGFSADQDSPFGVTDVSEAFDLPSACAWVAADGEPNAGAVRLEPIYPNPALTTASVTFTVPTARNVTVEVFDIVGRRVATLLNDTIEAGTHALQWNTGSIGAGLYIVRLRAGHQVEVQRLTVLGRK